MLWVAIAIAGLVATAAAVALAGRRVLFLYRLATSGQPAPERIEYARQHAGAEVKAQLVEVFGQRKLLKWTPSGTAHFFVMWAFFILASVYLEAYGALVQGAVTGTPDFRIPLIGTWPVLGFLQDFIAVAALIGLIAFAVIRVKNSPKKLGRGSRFSGSHLGGAWLILFMIFNVIWTMFLFRGAAVNTGNFPYRSGAFASQAVAKILPDSEGLEAAGLLLHIGVMLVFLVIVVNSKHLHIFTAPLNVLFSRRPDGLGPAQPMRSDGKVLDFEEADPETDVFGRGKIADTSWKGFLDFYTCTECGRCQSQCPAWNTGKPLSPKMLILDQRDHAFAVAPYLLAGEKEKESLSQDVLALLDKPLVGEDGVIHPDVLWSCTNCGACVEQCPVDIEHIDHILDMRRYQVMIESSFPSEAGVMLKNLENKGNPWGMSEMKRADWIEELDFEVTLVDEKMPEDVEYLFWVGCAGALEDRAKKTTKAVAELLHIAGVKFGVLGPMEACSGDPARRLGMEFLFSMLAQQNVETLNEAGVKKIVATCPHCFNTLANEYPQLGGHYEVVHHTQLLARLVEEGRLTPITPIEEKITYHDPCFLGRHNKVYAQPRDIMAKVPGVTTQEMHRCGDRGFCCGAGGARMWMEERIGKRINTERVDEALTTDPDTVSTACPFCLVMLGDAINEKKNAGQAKESIEVVDVAQLLIKSVKQG
ncbi:(Fe-S)-binding protein [Microbispora triticiradicis]|uniref:4Fe-4S dicluster domain-containing protein n=2 Tax=Microbispora TaxID=2005 RepID=A0ABY3M2S6_9ACTN|nr:MULTISPECIES: heterodisulfide reductase-related iron-sulfur binding cluster [Microbispora]TLP57705.1 4Fe-4S dicluster domain-containing protein [Microbispora fusca]TYB64697.1 4Fe-4S dicluster domain-containing protein [Microbispora tritici]